jgi:hypothetical protein
VRLSRVFSCVLFLAPISWASTIITSYPNGNGSAFALGDTSSAANGQRLAAGFTMGAQSFDLDSVTIGLAFVGIATFPGSILDASIYADGGGSPADPAGSALVLFQPPSGTLQGATLPNGFNDYTLLSESSFTLQAATRYWLVVIAADNGNLGWQETSSGPTGAFATDLGTRTGPGEGLPSIVTNASLLYQVDGTPISAGQVPEPGTVGLLSLGCFGLLLCRRFRVILQLPVEPRTGETPGALNRRG